LTDLSRYPKKSTANGDKRHAHERFARGRLDGKIVLAF
jgi:hypothetical protein